MQVSDDHFQEELGSGHPDDGQRRCRKRVEFYNRIKLG